MSENTATDHNFNNSADESHAESHNSDENLFPGNLVSWIAPLLLIIVLVGLLYFL